MAELEVKFVWVWGGIHVLHPHYSVTCSPNSFCLQDAQYTAGQCSWEHVWCGQLEWYESPVFTCPPTCRSSSRVYPHKARCTLNS